jgi:integrase
MLREAEEEGHIQKNPARNVSTLKKEYKKRILLTLDEFRTLFAEETLETVWGDETHYTINLLAATTGLRVGELQALQFCNIQEKHVDILHSWERKYGMKGTKTNTPRFVTTFSSTQKWLKSLLDKMPVRQEHDLVFSGHDRSTPIPYRTITDQFYSALDKIGITESIRRKREITFHSWRHFFISTMRTRLSDWKLRMLTGHKSSEMTDRYTSLTPNDFDDVRGIQEEVFGSNTKKVKEKE